MRRIQIGVIGSCSDLQYSDDAMIVADNLGCEIARNGYLLVFGAEKDCTSLPTIAALAARRIGGETLGITYEKGLGIYTPKAASSVVSTGMVRGGGRETALILSCDAVIAISGGSGTLNEICVAYQANIPVVVIDTYGGWSEKLARTFLDERRRYQFAAADSPINALKLAREQIKITNDTQAYACNTR